MFTGDLKPDLQITLSSAPGGVNIDDALAVRIIGKRGNTIVFDRAPSDTSVVGETSVVTMEWQVGDTAATGRIDLEVEVMWPGAKPQTFRPSAGVDIKPDFDLA